MLGFNAISEVAIADQPGVTLFLSGVSGTTAINAVGVESTGAVSSNGCCRNFSSWDMNSIRVSRSKCNWIFYYTFFR